MVKVLSLLRCILLVQKLEVQSLHVYQTTLQKTQKFSLLRSYNTENRHL